MAQFSPSSPINFVKSPISNINTVDLVIFANYKLREKSNQRKLPNLQYIEETLLVNLISPLNIYIDWGGGIPHVRSAKYLGVVID